MTLTQPPSVTQTKLAPGMYVRFKHYRCCGCQPNRGFGIITQTPTMLEYTPYNLQITHSNSNIFSSISFFHKIECLDRIYININNRLVGLECLDSILV